MTALEMYNKFNTLIDETYSSYFGGTFNDIANKSQIKVFNELLDEPNSNDKSRKLTSLYKQQLNYTTTNPVPVGTLDGNFYELINIEVYDTVAKIFRNTILNQQEIGYDVFSNPNLKQPQHLQNGTGASLVYNLYPTTITAPIVNVYWYTKPTTIDYITTPSFVLQFPDDVVYRIIDECVIEAKITMNQLDSFQIDKINEQK